MPLLPYCCGSSISSSSISDELDGRIKMSPSVECALSALELATASSTPELTDRITTVPDSSETIAYLFSKKIKTPESSITLEIGTPDAYRNEPYLTLSDLGAFKLLPKKEAQSKYVSSLNDIDRPLSDKELTAGLKNLYLLLFCKIDLSASNYQEKRLPEIIARHQINPKTSENNLRLLTAVYTKYVLASDG